jgi:hypothetical protein
LAYITQPIPFSSNYTRVNSCSLSFFTVPFFLSLALAFELNKPEFAVPRLKIWGGNWERN